MNAKDTKGMQRPSGKVGADTGSSKRQDDGQNTKEGQDAARATQYAAYRANGVFLSIAEADRTPDDWKGALEQIAKQIKIHSPMDGQSCIEPNDQSFKALVDLHNTISDRIGVPRYAFVPGVDHAFFCGTKHSGQPGPRS